MTAKMIIDTLRIVTTVFLIFAGGCLFTSFCKSPKNEKAANAIGSLFMIFAIVFMWLEV